MKKITERQETPLVSIIVPVYQVEAYISECVESLLAQTYTNIEILLVDDGSTDSSGEICEEYAVKDDRVRVIHQRNQGPSVARNSGLDHMKGEYVAFVDSDDAVLPDFIESLYELLEKHHADIAACAYEECGADCFSYIKREASCIENGGSKRRIKEECVVQNVKKEMHDNDKEISMISEQMLQQWHGKYKKWETVVWNKLYQKSIFYKGGEAVIRFPDGRKLEDVLISHLLVANAKQVVLTMRKLYLYRIRPDSRASQSRMTGLMRENLRAQRERMAFFKERRYWRAYLNLLWGYVLHLGWFGWKWATGNQ